MAPHLRAAKPRQAAYSLAAYLSIASLFLTICFTWGRSHLYGDGFFWDGRVYRKALAAWHLGQDPYAGAPTSLLFVCPPLFLHAGAFLSHLFPGHTGWFLYIAAVILATLCLPALLALFYLRSEWLTPLIAITIFTLQPHFTTERSMNAGNLVIPLYALALLAGISGVRRNRWRWFYLVVLVAALTKPALLALLLLPLLAGTRQYRQSAATAAVVLAAYTLQRLTMPHLYLAFEQAVYRQVVLKHDFGVGTYDWFYRAADRIPALRSLPLDSLLHLALLACFIVPLFLLRHTREHPAVAPLWLPALLVTAIVANPRMQDYDSCLAILPALFIWLESLRSAPRNGRSMANAALTANLLIVLFTTSYEAGINVIFFGAILLTVLKAQAVSRATAQSLA